MEHDTEGHGADIHDNDNQYWCNVQEEEGQATKEQGHWGNYFYMIFTNFLSKTIPKIIKNSSNWAS